jgi:hypothetical protein
MSGAARQGVVAGGQKRAEVAGEPRVRAQACFDFSERTAVTQHRPLSRAHSRRTLVRTGPVSTAWQRRRPATRPASACGPRPSGCWPTCSARRCSVTPSLSRCMCCTRHSGTSLRALWRWSSPRTPRPYWPPCCWPGAPRTRSAAVRGPFAAQHRHRNFLGWRVSRGRLG